MKKEFNRKREIYVNDLLQDNRLFLNVFVLQEKIWYKH